MKPLAAPIEPLHRQADWLQRTLASIGDAVITADLQGHITFMNRVAEALTGWPRDKALGRPLREILPLLHEQSREPLEDPALRVLREGKVVTLDSPAILLARDGAERCIDDSAAPMRDEAGNMLGVVLIFRDVSERRRIEQARAFLAAIVASSDDVIISKTLDGVIRTWNAAAERVFGYQAEEAIGRPITLIVPPELLDQEQEILARIRSGERVEHFETVRLSKQGRRIDISLTVSPVRDSTGRIIGASKIARDISERRRTEKALREANRRKDEFIALLAHELRNPLAPLHTGLEVMRLAPADPKAIAQAQAMMARQLGIMVRLIDDLLDVSRIARNKMELRRARVLLTDVLSSAVETARPLLEAAGHNFTVALPPEPVFLDADLTRLAQVFGNLLTNSAKYTEPGGRIWLTATHLGKEVFISVRDTGIGIPAEDLPHIFDMFSQVSRNLERSAGGLGIGLALVKGLVEMHGGAVTAESAGVGKGSTFTVRLPALERLPAALAGDALPGASAAKGPGRRILVVDDNQDSANSMATLLALMGNEVQTAHDGAAAIIAAERFRPEVILMDVGMPRLNGYEATRRIREQPWAKSIAIIALTGWGQAGDRERSREAGCDGHLVKPVNLSDLEKLLASIANLG